MFYECVAHNSFSFHGLQEAPSWNTHVLLDRHRLLDVVTGSGDIAELEKRDSCIHLARVALQLMVVS